MCLPASVAEGSWSAPRVLAAGCALVGGPQVAFPSEGPTLPTGEGAIVWASEESRCESSASGAPPTFAVTVAAIGRNERPSSVRERALEGVFTGELTAVGADFGQLAIAAGAQGEIVSAGAGTEVLQGRATRPLGSPAAVAAGLPSVLTRAYLGDVAVATVAPGQIDVRVERWDHRGFHPNRVVPVGAGPVTAIAVTMDYRSDLLLAWQQSGSIFARVLRAHGTDDPTQRLGPSEPEPQLQAMLSDNNHGMVAWSSTSPAGSGGSAAPVTTTYIDISGTGVRFGGPQTVATYSDPAEVGKSEGSLALVRLADENVQMGWTTVEDGHYVVRRCSPIRMKTRFWRIWPPARRMRRSRCGRTAQGRRRASRASRARRWRACRGNRRPRRRPRPNRRRASCGRRARRSSPVTTWSFSPRK